MPPSTTSTEAGKVNNEKGDYYITRNGDAVSDVRESLSERADGGNAAKRPDNVDAKLMHSSFPGKFESRVGISDKVAAASVEEDSVAVGHQNNSIVLPAVLGKSEEDAKEGQDGSVQQASNDTHREFTTKMAVQLVEDDTSRRAPTLRKRPSESDGDGTFAPNRVFSLTSDRLLELVHADGSLPSPQFQSPKPGASEADANADLLAVSQVSCATPGQKILRSDGKPASEAYDVAVSTAEGHQDPLGTTRNSMSMLNPIAEQNSPQTCKYPDARVNSSGEQDTESQPLVSRRLLGDGGELSLAFADSPLSPSTRVSNNTQERPSINSRALSTPVMKRKISSNKTSGLAPLSIPPPKSARTTSYLGSREAKSAMRQEPKDVEQETHVSTTLPVPPFSLPTHLHLELSSSRPSPLYIQRQQGDELPYEPSHVKLQRLLNFLLLPPMLEGVLLFGALACFDAWLYTFTILPLRFCKAVTILAESWFRNIIAEISEISQFIYAGLGRLWHRRKLASKENDGKRPNDLKISARTTAMNTPGASSAERPDYLKANGRASSSETHGRRLGHRRTKSGPSLLLPVDKADILKGLLIITSCYILLYFDASMMYHNIRGQAAIKLYVIYNALEVFDRLLSALGQDVLECLFAKDTLDRKPNGRSKLLRPAWLFLLALVYNIVHSLALFYQVITLNVAVNSYSNALLTLLMSNQFVEIKSTVFKKIEKENLFQMTCADIVERFQLWLMLIIIASRNIVETGGLSGLSGGNSTGSSPTDRGPSLLPHSFTLLPDWTGVVMGPFFLVLGTEMLVDWIKHAYINKFNATKPNVYGRFLDILAKDYYSRAFTDPDLTRRVGLATIPLSCLFIRASVQTYHMFLATHTISPLPSTTSLETPFTSPETTPAIRAAIQHIDGLFKRAIFGADSEEVGSVLQIPWLESVAIQLPSLDTVLTYLATMLIFTIFFLLLLILKILLGMFLLSYARGRYATMQQREKESSRAEGRRFGGWGVTELGDEKRKWIYEDDPEGLKKMRERERDSREREGRGEKGLEHVERYSMVAKRIW